jgi:membrane protein
MKTPNFAKPYLAAGKDFVDDDAPQAAAALSFYAVTALPPMVVVLMSIIGLFYNDGTAVNQLSDQVSQMMGPSVADVITTIVENRSDSGHGTATVLGLLVLLVSASGFFAQLQKAMNQVWEVRPRPDAGLWLTVKKRMIGMSAVLGTAFLLVVSLVLSAVIASASSWLEQNVGVGSGVSLLGQAVVSLVVVTGLFALIFKVLPDVVIRWKDVWRGALTTAVLFMVGKYALAWYLGRSDMAAGYGAAGALVLVLFWVYFSSMILLYGAELTQIKAKEHGRELEPEPHAERVVEIARAKDKKSPTEDQNDEDLEKSA